MDSSLRPIVVAGPFGVGKDYVAGVIGAALNSANRPAEIFALGDYYYDVVASRYGLTIDDVRRRKPEFRSELQTVGGDSQYIEAAIDVAAQRVGELVQRGVTPIIVTRKAHEIREVRDRTHARTLAVDAPVADRVARIEQRDGHTPTVDQLHHAVEEPPRSLPVDLVIPNDIGAGPLHAQLTQSKLFLRNLRFGYALDLRMPNMSLRFSA